MIATRTPQHESPVDPWLQSSCEGCLRLIAEAEREMRAFVSAAREIFGSATAVRAAEYWIELAETVSPPAVEGRLHWRKLTIIASSRLAADHSVCAEAAEELAKRKSISESPKRSPGRVVESLAGPARGN